MRHAGGNVCGCLYERTHAFTHAGSIVRCWALSARTTRRHAPGFHHVHARLPAVIAAIARHRAQFLPHRRRWGPCGPLGFWEDGGFLGRTGQRDVGGGSRPLVPDFEDHRFCKFIASVLQRRFGSDFLSPCSIVVEICGVKKDRMNICTSSLFTKFFPTF